MEHLVRRRVCEIRVQSSLASRATDGAHDRERFVQASVSRRKRACQIADPRATPEGPARREDQGKTKDAAAVQATGTSMMPMHIKCRFRFLNRHTDVTSPRNVATNALPPEDKARST